MDPFWFVNNNVVRARPRPAAAAVNGGSEPQLVSCALHLTTNVISAVLFATVFTHKVTANTATWWRFHSRDVTFSGCAPSRPFSRSRFPSQFVPAAATTCTFAGILSRESTLLGSLW